MALILNMHLIAALVVAVALCPSDAFVFPRLSSARSVTISTFFPPSHATNSAEEELKDTGTGFRQQLWDERISELIKYNETFGTVNVAYSHELYNGDEWGSLAKWVHTIRSRQGRLSEERHSQLTAMGFTWTGAKEEKDDQQWQGMFQRLVGHKEVHGDCLVPQKWDIDKPLGFWVQHQRHYKKIGTLSEDREAKLDSIGFVWVVRKLAKPKSRKRDRQWCRMYIKLIRHYREHGDYWVQIDLKNKDNPMNPLGHWVHTQRQLFKNGKNGKLREDRKERLFKIGFTWDANEKLETQWYEKFNQLKEILDKKRYDRANSELFTATVLGDNLYRWVCQQRLMNEKDSLDPKRKALLNDIGFEWVQVSGI